MSNEKKVVVAIGDWYIDENWYVLPQKLFHSSHTGDSQYLSTIKKTGGELISFCAVGGLLYFLQRYLKNPKNSLDKYEFHGFGVWNPFDNDIMQCIMCPKHSEFKLLTPHTFLGLQLPSKNPEGKRNCPYEVIANIDKGKESVCMFEEDIPINFHNMVSGDYQEAIRSVKDEEQSEENQTNANSRQAVYSTNHVIRCFEGFPGQNPRLTHRFDWVSDIKEGDLNEIEKTEFKGKNIVAIIIEDHGLGVINDTTINKINEFMKDNDKTKIFVRTKNANPSWLKKLNRIDLIVADHNLARHIKGHRQWVYEKEMGGAALKLINNLRAKEYKDGKIQKIYESLNIKAAAILLDNNSVIAGFNDKCFFVKEPLEKKQILNTGRTTTFYAALIGQIINGNNNGAEEFYNFCFQARECAYEWSKQVSEKWEQSDVRSRINYIYHRIADRLSKLDTDFSSNSYIKNQSEITTIWEDSAKNYGLVTIGRNKVLQLWRALGTLSNYIVVWGDKRDAINSLITRVAEFNADKSPKQSLSCLLTASPGWGKSFLAHKLADRFDMTFLEFSIAQMPTTDAFVDCLATIASVQNRSKNKVLIFIDEINAEIEGHSVYGLLLGPLSDGGFVFEGKSYRLDPASWVIASSKSIFASDINDNDALKDPKGSDFITRLNGPIISLDYDTGKGEYSKAMALFKHKLYSVSDYVSEQNPNKNIRLLGDIYDYKPESGETEINNDNNKTLYEIILEERLKSEKLLVEQVYLIVSLIIKYNGPIRKVQFVVLRLFRELIAINGIRSIEYFASCFDGIRNGEVTWKNVPDLGKYVSLRRHVVMPKEWISMADRTKYIEDYKNELYDVEIQTSPEDFNLGIIENQK